MLNSMQVAFVAMLASRNGRAVSDQDMQLALPGNRGVLQRDDGLIEFPYDAVHVDVVQRAA